MNGNLYTLDAANPRVRKITAAAEVSTYAGINAIGFRDGAAATAQFGQSFGIVSDVVGNIYVADSQNNRIRKISTNQEVTTVAGTALQGNSDGKGDIAQFYFITGIAMDKCGNLFVSDINRIRKITATGVVSTFAGSNISGYVDGKKEIARFSQIEDLAIDDRGNIYLTDGNRIRKINPQGLVTTVAGSVAGYKDGDATAAKFDGPQGLAIDNKGNIYVADFNNHRIRKIGVN
jgi:sugar lactone lactonase YvrE